MGHSIDITEGVASFASSRNDAWHQLGQVAEGAMTAQQALEMANLAGWDLRKMPIFTRDEDQGLFIPIPGRHGIVRTNPVTKRAEAIGDVGDAYTIVQNEELTGLLDTLVDESGAHYETAGALDGGKKVFVTMKMPKHIMVGGVDKVDTYIAAMTSHDGSTSTTFMNTPVRIVCQNTLNLAFGEATHMFKVRHTTGAQNILAQQAREALEFTFNYLGEFEKQAEQLIQTSMTQMQFEAIIHEEFAAYEDSPAAVITRAQNKVDEICSLFSDSDTHADVRDTAWAGLNALTEWADHYSPVREANGLDDSVRARKALLDTKFKNNALNLMLQAV